MMIYVLPFGWREETPLFSLEAMKRQKNRSDLIRIWLQYVSVTLYDYMIDSNLLFNKTKPVQQGKI